MYLIVICIDSQYITYLVKFIIIFINQNIIFLIILSRIERREKNNESTIDFIESL